MKNKITFNNDFTKAYVSSSFMKKARVYGSLEYKMLTEFRAANPNVAIETRKNASSVNYNMTFENMEAYIRTKTNASVLLPEFERVKKEAVVQRNRHLYVVGWFKEMFPDYTTAEQFQKADTKKAEITALPAASENDDKESA